MKNRILFLAGLILGVTTVSVLFLHQNRSLRQALMQQCEKITLLEGMQTENADLRNHLSRQQVTEWEVETLRKQAQDVHRLRGQVGELLRLRRENQELDVQLAGLTNRLQQLAEQNEKRILQLLQENENLQQRAMTFSASGNRILVGEGGKIMTRNPIDPHVVELLLDSFRNER